MTELTQTHKHIVCLSSIAIVYGFWINLSFTRLLEQDWHDITNDILHVKQLLSQVAEPTHTSDIFYNPIDVGAVMSSSDACARRGVTRPVIEYWPLTFSPFFILSLLAIFVQHAFSMAESLGPSSRLCSLPDVSIVNSHVTIEVTGFPTLLVH
jgi:hypothetical protein